MRNRFRTAENPTGALLRRSRFHTVADAPREQRALLLHVPRLASPGQAIAWQAVGLWAATIAYAFANLPVIAMAMQLEPIDWETLAHTPAWFMDGSLYERRPELAPVAWSPLVPLIVAPLVPLGYYGWVALHAVAVAAVRSPLLIAATLGSAAFWADLGYGNSMTFVFAAGVLALRGSSVGTSAYIALTVLMPRPIQLPLFVWILWRQKEARRRAVWIFLLHGVAVLLTGYGDDWVRALFAMGESQFASGVNWGPTRIIGAWWLPFGAVLAAVLTLKGKVGLAGLAMSPYIFPQYLLVALWEVQGIRLRNNGGNAVPREASIAPAGEEGPGKA